MQKTYILDTNVLLENPRCIPALRNGAENRVVLPYTVLLELDKLKKDQRLGHIAAAAIRSIQNDTELAFLPRPAASGTTLNDDVILAEILASEISDPILVSNDRIMQIKARIEGIAVESYRDSIPFQSASQAYTGFLAYEDPLIANCFQWESGTPLFHGPQGTKLIDYQHTPWGIRPRNVHQNLALELMLNEDIDLVSIQSEAGYGKTFLALAAALYLVLEAKSNPFRKIFVVKPVVEIGARMGFLPGDVDQKMAPYIRYITDLIGKLHDIRPANRIFTDPEANRTTFNPRKLEILPIAYIRGMNLENCVVIIDEMQNMSRHESRALLTRMGEGVKCFCLGDTRQVDNPYLSENNNGLNWAVKKFKGMSNYAHLVLKGNKSRGPITDMVIKSGL
jgi:PhoH-like ATPase